MTHRADDLCGVQDGRTVRTSCQGEPDQTLPGVRARPRGGGVSRFLTPVLALVALTLAGAPCAQADPLGWGKWAGGASSGSGNGIAVDGAGNSNVTGTFRGTATFGAGEANETTLTYVAGGQTLIESHRASLCRHRSSPSTALQ